MVGTIDDIDISDTHTELDFRFGMTRIPVLSDEEFYTSPDSPTRDSPTFFPEVEDVTKQKNVLFDVCSDTPILDSPQLPIASVPNPLTNIHLMSMSSTLSSKEVDDIDDVDDVDDDGSSHKDDKEGVAQNQQNYIPVKVLGNMPLSIIIRMTLIFILCVVVMVLMIELWQLLNTSNTLTMHLDGALSTSALQGLYLASMTENDATWSYSKMLASLGDRGEFSMDTLGDTPSTNILLSFAQLISENDKDKISGLSIVSSSDLGAGAYISIILQSDLNDKSFLGYAFVRQPQTLATSCGSRYEIILSDTGPTLSNPSLGWCQYDPLTSHPGIGSAKVDMRVDRPIRPPPYASRTLSGNLMESPDVLAIVWPTFTDQTSSWYYRMRFKSNKATSAKSNGFILVEGKLSAWRNSLVSAVPTSVIERNAVGVLVDVETQRVLSSTSSIVGIPGSLAVSCQDAGIAMATKSLFSEFNVASFKDLIKNIKRQNYVGVESRRNNRQTLLNYMDPDFSQRLSEFQNNPVFEEKTITEKLQIAVMFSTPTAISSNNAGLGLLIAGGLLSITIIVILSTAHLPLFQRDRTQHIVLDKESATRSDIVTRLAICFGLVIFYLFFAWIIWSAVNEVSVRATLGSISELSVKYMTTGIHWFSEMSIRSNSVLLTLGRLNVLGTSYRQNIITFKASNQGMCDITYSFAALSSGVLYSNIDGQSIGCLPTSAEGPTALMATEPVPGITPLANVLCLQMYNLTSDFSRSAKVVGVPICPYDRRSNVGFLTLRLRRKNRELFLPSKEFDVTYAGGKQRLVWSIPFMLSDGYQLMGNDVLGGVAEHRISSENLGLLLRSISLSISQFWKPLSPYVLSDDVRSPVVFLYYDVSRRLFGSSVEEEYPTVEGESEDPLVVPLVALVDLYSNAGVKAGLEILDRYKYEGVTNFESEITILEALSVTVFPVSLSDKFVDPCAGKPPCLSQFFGLTVVTRRTFDLMLNTQSSEFFYITFVLIAVIIFVISFTSFIISHFKESNKLVKLLTQTQMPKDPVQGSYFSRNTNMKVSDVMRMLHTLMATVEESTTLEESYAASKKIFSFLGGVSPETAILLLEYHEKDILYDSLKALVFTDCYQKASASTILLLCKISQSYLLFYFKIIVMICYAFVLIWFEPSKFTEPNTSVAVVVVETVCVVFLAAEFINRSIVQYYETKLWPISTQTRCFYALHGFLVALYLYDMAVDLSSISGGGTIIRIARPWRLVVSLFVFPYLGKKSIIIFKSLIDLHEVVFLLFSFCVVVSVLAIALFSLITELDSNNMVSTHQPWLYGDFLRSFWGIFILFVGENFNVSVFPFTTSTSWPYALFFCVVPFIGSFFINALTIFVFAEAYSRHSDHSCIKNRQRRWRALSGVFFSLDKDNSESLSRKEIDDFMKNLWARDSLLGGRDHDETLDDILKECSMHLDVSGTNEVDIVAFERLYTNVRYLEVLSASDCDTRKSTSLLSRCTSAIASTLPFVLLVVSVLYGTVSDSLSLDKALLAFIPMFWVIDTLRMYIIHFWKTDFVSGVRSWVRSLAGRSDGLTLYCDVLDRLTLLLATGGWLWSVATSLDTDNGARKRYNYAIVPEMSPEFAIVDNSNVKRFLLILPILRIFTIVKGLKNLSFLFVVVTTKCSEVGTVVFIFFYAITMFYVQFYIGTAVGNLVPSDDLWTGFVSIISAWYDDSFRGIEATNSAATFFFIVFVLLFILLSLELCVGIVMARANELEKVEKNKAGDKSSQGYYTTLFDLFTEKERLDFEENASIIRMNLRHTWNRRWQAKEGIDSEDSDHIQDALWEITQFEKFLTEDMQKLEAKAQRLKTHLAVLECERKVNLTRVQQASLAFQSVATSSGPQNASSTAASWAATKFKLNVAKKSQANTSSARVENDAVIGTDSSGL